MIISAITFVFLFSCMCFSGFSFQQRVPISWRSLKCRSKRTESDADSSFQHLSGKSPACTRWRLFDVDVSLTDDPGKDSFEVSPSLRLKIAKELGMKKGKVLPEQVCNCNIILKNPDITFMFDAILPAFAVHL